MPKNRATVYAVVRLPNGVEDALEKCSAADRPVLIGVYLTRTRAEEIAGKSSQQMKDLNIHGFNFDTQTVTYYEE